jgi:hypothetical protein
MRNLLQKGWEIAKIIKINKMKYKISKSYTNLLQNWPSNNKGKKKDFDILLIFI